MLAFVAGTDVVPNAHMEELEDHMNMREAEDVVNTHVHDFVIV